MQRGLRAAARRQPSQKSTLRPITRSSDALGRPSRLRMRRVPALGAPHVAARSPRSRTARARPRTARATRRRRVRARPGRPSRRASRPTCQCAGRDEAPGPVADVDAVGLCGRRPRTAARRRAPCQPQARRARARAAATGCRRRRSSRATGREPREQPCEVRQRQRRAAPARPPARARRRTGSAGACGDYRSRLLRMRAIVPRPSCSIRRP